VIVLKEPPDSGSMSGFPKLPFLFLGKGNPLINLVVASHTEGGDPVVRCLDAFTFPVPDLV
jgi:hypothetical protein